ncbi:hypothetical protein MTR67_007757 [Solanum verrucosum]|uniref:Uncharacterized protein n=1 Tax=Solanum verrucosum TaxID=315347 RepID=A0AAF0Q0V0_SOLVR|nr:hypothetical protein MTR67_007757 [Solanum verrucosum]
MEDTSSSQGDRVGAVYVKLTSCHLKLDHKHEAARAYDIDVDYYKMMKNLKGCVVPYCAIVQILGDVVAINNALERYQILDKTFPGTRECKFLMLLLTKRDVAEFTSCLKEYDSTIKLVEWRTPVLLMMKEALKAKELESKGQGSSWSNICEISKFSSEVDHKHEVARAYDIAVEYYKMTKKMKGYVLPYCAILQILSVAGTSYRYMSISCRGNIMSRESNTFISGHWKAKRNQRTLPDTGYNIFRDARVHVSNGMPYSL